MGGAVLTEVQVFDPVVVSHMVFVMDDLLIGQEPADVFFHDQSVLKNVPVQVGVWMIWALHPHIPIIVVTAPTLPAPVQTSRLGNLATVFGGVRLAVVLVARDVSKRTPRSQLARWQSPVDDNGPTPAGARGP
jgi:hypothetical protein